MVALVISFFKISAELYVHELQKTQMFWGFGFCFTSNGCGSKHPKAFKIDYFRRVIIPKKVPKVLNHSQMGFTPTPLGVASRTGSSQRISRGACTLDRPSAQKRD